jgi:hypothetical protein
VPGCGGFVEGKHDYEGALSPLVIEEYGRYMHAARKVGAGPLRDSDNWQKGMPRAEYLKSAWRHFHHLWMLHRGYVVTEKGKLVTAGDACCGVLFNVMGYLHEYLKERLAG